MDEMLKNPVNIPFNIAYAVRKQEQIDSFMEMTEKKRPPKNIWHNDYLLNAWLEEAFSDKDTGASMAFRLDEVE